MANLNEESVRCAAEAKKKDAISASLVVDDSCDVQSNKRHKSRRRVKLAINDDEEEEENSGNGLVVYQREPLSDEESRSYYMQPEDFRRCNVDVRDTIVEWVNYKMGKRQEFGEYNTTRGLEELLDHVKCNKSPKRMENSRVCKKSQHIRKVLQEVNRQQSTSSVKLLDADQLRQVSLELSEADRQRAILIAGADEEEARAFLSSGLSVELDEGFDLLAELQSPEPTTSDHTGRQASGRRRGRRGLLALFRRKSIG